MVVVVLVVEVVELDEVVGALVVVGASVARVEMSDAPAPVSIAAAWLQADASRQPPINQAVRCARTADTLQIPRGGVWAFRSCSPFRTATGPNRRLPSGFGTHSVGAGSGP